MWKHCTTKIHERDGHSIHVTEQNNLNLVILHEWATGLGNLPENYSTLFNKSEEYHLSETFQRQRQWLASIWTAREQCNYNANLIDEFVRNVHKLYLAK